MRGGGRALKERDDVRPGLRVVGLERRVSIAFVVEDARVGHYEPFIW